jgi:carbamoyltransferase
MVSIVGLYAIPDTNSYDYPEWVHDHNITILNGGNLIRFLHLERFSRIKYHSGFPQLLDDVARKLQLIPAKDTIFVFVDHEVGRSFISTSGKIRYEAPLSEKLDVYPEKGNLYWFGEKCKAYSINHELAHIYSCVPFYGYFKEKSLLIHFDGGASKSNFSAWLFNNNKISLLEAHYKYKKLSSLFNANALVFKIVGAKRYDQNSVPGKFMGLEAFGSYRREIEEWLVENNFFETIWASPGHFFESVQEKFGIGLKAINSRNSFIQDIVATIHEVFVREMLDVFRRLREETNASYLYYSGGSALNIKLNARLLRENIFNEIYIPPCTNDSGLSLGAASAVSIMEGIPVSQVGPYLNNFRIENKRSFNFSGQDIEQISINIAKGKIIGICNGYGEIGPRALGNRSIVARADSMELARHISVDLKMREWYRPIAPVMLLRNARYFTGLVDFPVVSKYMLTEFQIIPERIKDIKGCVHIDGTSRIQILFKRDENPFLYDLLCLLEEKFNIRALINTSFNRSGEPIVHTDDQAVETAKAMKLDGVVLDGKYCELHE